MRVYFITGTTGVVGSALVPFLLEDTDTEVVLLIRAADDTDLARRLDALFAFWGPERAHAWRDRIRALRGDAAEPAFGLAAGEYRRLSERCTHIIHSAGTVKMNLPIEEARRSAVASVREILALARLVEQRGGLAKVEVVSTVGIAGKRAGALPERWIDEPRAFHNTYEQAKSEAEDIVREAIEREGLPITVHRPSMVVGDSRDGRVIHFQIFYFICEFLSGRRTFGLYPDFGGVQLDIVPSDFVARAIAASSREASTAGRIFHLSSGPAHAPRIEEMKGIVRAAWRAHGLEVPSAITLPRHLYGRLARAASWIVPGALRKPLSTLPIYLDYLADRQGFDNRELATWLAARGTSVPRARDYLPVVLGRYLAERHRRG
ncbi:MAG: hypothetical protein OHK0026_10720 [Rhodocyclaceae bacterium]